MKGSEMARFAALLLIGVAGSGLAKYYLTTSGYSTLGTVVWVLGYAGMVLVIWFVWIRPLQLRGPSG